MIPSAMRRMDRKLDEKETYRILDHGEYGIIGLMDDEGIPYQVPLNYCRIKNSIYFHSAVMGQKIEIIEKNSNTSFCVVGSTEVLPGKFGTLYESVILQGNTCEVFDDEKKAGLTGLLQKYSKDYIPQGMKYIDNAIAQCRVFKISIKNISGKGNRGKE